MARANNNQRGSGGSFDDDEDDVIIAFARFASSVRPRKLSRKGKQCGREKQMPTTDGPTQKQLLLLTLKGPKANQDSWAGLTVKLGENEFTVV